jgi:hypothetical protein
LPPSFLENDLLHGVMVGGEQVEYRAKLEE